eukprot:6985881-Pyramimonas_sp.AAC.3
MSDRICVLVRVRPLIPREILDEVVVDAIENKTVRVCGSNSTLESNFDYVFDQTAGQADVYSRVQGMDTLYS